MNLLLDFCCLRKKTEIGPRRNEVVMFRHIGVNLTHDMIVLTTENFSPRHCIGAGGFGQTYLAEVAPGKLIAVKRLGSDRIQGALQFKAEVNVLGQVRHSSIINLIGHYEGQVDTLLIYNFLPGGSLDSFIRTRNPVTIDWGMLHKIALQIASAVYHLHCCCKQRVLHRDIKPSNILLDSEDNAYLSDFGLSKVLAVGEPYTRTRVAGTYGYIAPEYASTGLLSIKADVYSYGVMVLELISDKRVLDPSFDIVSWAREMLDQGQVRDVFVDGLWERGPREEMVKVLNLAILCTVKSAVGRPNMRDVVKRLKEIRPPNDSEQGRALC